MTLLHRTFLKTLPLVLALTLLLPAVRAAADTVYSINNNESVSVIVTTDDSVTTPISLPTGTKPTALCLNPVTATAYTLNTGNNTLSIIDTTGQTVVNTVYDPRFTELTALACAPTGTSVLIGNNDSGGTSSRILFLDTATNTLNTLSTPVGTNPGSIVFNRNGSKAYILNQGVPAISVLDTATKQITATMPLSEADTPYALAMHTLDKYLYVVNIFGNSVSIIDPSTMLLLKAVTVGNYPNSLAVSSSTNRLYIADYLDTISLFDPESQTISSTFTSQFPIALLERNDGQRVYIASMADDIIRSYDTSDFTAAPRQIQLPAGSSPRGLATLLGSRHNLALSISGTGTGTVEWPFTKGYTPGQPVTAQVGVPEGIGATVHAAADSCSTVTWAGCDTVSGGGTRSAFCSVSPFSSDKTINAEFIQNPSHNVTVTISGGTGTVTCPAQVCDGGTASCSVSPAPGYTLTSLTDNGATIMSDVAGGTSFQIQNIVGDHSITAGFSINSFTVTASADANGSISPSTPQTVPYGNTVSFTLTPPPVSVNGCGGTLSGSTYTTAPITGDCAVSASFSAGTFTVTSQVTGGGTVSCQPTVSSGGNAVCTVTPNTGYHLTTLNDNGIDKTYAVSGSSYLIKNVVTHHDVAAYFTIDQYPVSLNPGNNGSISGPLTVSYGDTPTYTFTPSGGYHISNVIIGGGSVGAVNSYTLPGGVTGPLTISALFEMNQYQVTPSAGTGGAISPSSSRIVDHGNTTSFTITPDSANGYRIDTVTGCSGTLNGTTYTTAPITSSCSVTATFALNQYQVAPSAGSGGGISPATPQTVTHRASTSFTITPDSVNGYGIASVTGCGGTLNGTTYTTAPVTSACSVSAAFALNQYQVTPSAGPGGGISPAPVQNVAHGSSTSFTIVPDSANGYRIDTVTGCGGTLSGTTYTTGIITSACTVSASFTLEQFAVTPVAAAGGNISPTVVQNVPFGSTASFSITEDSANGYRIDTVTGCDDPLSGIPGVLNGNTYTTGPITSPCTVSATFALNSYLVTPSAGTGGSIDPATAQSVIHGSSASFTITPDSTHSITNVSGCNGTLAGNTYTTGAITADCSISAIFDPSNFSVTSTIPGGNGAVSCTPAIAIALSSVSCTITPANGYQLASLTDNGNNAFSAVSGSTYTISDIQANHALTATFSLIQYQVTASAGTGGTLSPSTPQTIAHGNTASFTITPDSANGYKIASVTGCGDPLSGIPGTLTGSTYTTGPITAACSVSAAFSLNQYQVPPSAGTGGSISPAAPQSVVHGTTTSFTVTPDSANGYRINSVTGCGGTLNGTTYTTAPITSLCSVSASFVLNRYEVTPSAGTGGSVSPATVQSVAHGSSASFTIVPDSANGYKIDSVTGCGGTLSGTTYTTAAITSACSVSASFVLEQYAVTPTAGPGGTISPNAAQSIAYGSTASFTVTADSANGYKVSSVTGCGGTLNGTTYTTGPITAACSVSAVFSLNQFQVAPSAGTGGNISPSAVQNISLGGSASFTITPETASGYTIASVSGCGGTLNGTTYTTGAITADCTISALFELSSYLITSSIPGGNGSVSCTPATASFGSSSTCTIAPANGYRLASLSDNGIDVLPAATPASYTIAAITANHALAATFALQNYAVTVSSGANGSTTPGAVQTVTRGNTASFKLLPDTGYHIVTPVGGTCGGTLNGTTYTTAPITADCTVAVDYALNQYTVNAAAGTGGSIAPGTSSIPHGSSAMFSVVPASGYSVGSVSGCSGSLSGNVYTTGLINGDCSISATFIALHSVTASVSGGGGSVICPAQVKSGDSATCLITPDIGYHLASLTDNGVSALAAVTGKSTYSLNGVLSPHVISSSFAPYSLADPLRALRIAVGIVPPTVDEYQWLDVAPLDADKPKGNGMIDILDALVLLKHHVGAYTSW